MTKYARVVTHRRRLEPAEHLLVRTGAGVRAEQTAKRAPRLGARTPRALVWIRSLTRHPRNRGRASGERDGAASSAPLNPDAAATSHAAKGHRRAERGAHCGVDDARRRRDWKRAEVLPRFNSARKEREASSTPRRRRRPARGESRGPVRPRAVRPAAPPARPKAARSPRVRWWRRRVRRV